jgi:DNA invertase Pin-like site-specific DNA recombinase
MRHAAVKRRSLCEPTCRSDVFFRFAGAAHQQGIDTATPAGKAMFQMMGVFAEFERAMIQERVRAGLARAVAEGTKLGRPKTEAAIEKTIRAALQKGDAGMHKIAARFGVGTGTVQRIKADMAA